jgi:hypothetical protein
VLGFALSCLVALTRLETRRARVAALPNLQIYTIYRLVAQHTIEEKIVDLHKHDLADSSIEGADMSGKVSTTKLLRLIHEQPVDA